MTDEDLIDGGPNSMGHPVTKPMRMIESENLSENMNIYQSIPDQVRIMRSELGRIQHELQAQQETIKENEKKIKQNNTLPYLVCNIIEVLEVNVDLDIQEKV